MVMLDELPNQGRFGRITGCGAQLCDYDTDMAMWIATGEQGPDFWRSAWPIDKETALNLARELIECAERLP